MARLVRAVTLTPGVANSAKLEEIPEPEPSQGEILVAAHAVGVCGTDREILAGEYGEAAPGRERLILGHESIGRVLEAPAGGDLRAGDWVAGIVRHPDPVPCGSCRVGEWDMCRNGRYTEHGIKGLDGFAVERYRLQPRFAVKVDPALGPLGVLVEPASVVAKAWDHIERIGRRATFEPKTALITGAGPIGLLAALFAVQRGLTVRVLDRAKDGPKPELVRALGASYHVGRVEDLCPDADVVVECTGASSVIFGAIGTARPNGIICLTGVSRHGRRTPIDVGAVNRELVLENNVVFGTVNANRAHYEQAVRALVQADRGWLERLVTRWMPIERWAEALVRDPGGVKTAIVFA